MQRMEDCELSITRTAIPGLQLRGLVELPRVVLSKTAMKGPPSLQYFLCCLQEQPPNYGCDSEVTTNLKIADNPHYSLKKHHKAWLSTLNVSYARSTHTDSVGDKGLALCTMQPSKMQVTRKSLQRHFSKSAEWHKTADTTLQCQKILRKMF